MGKIRNRHRRREHPKGMVLQPRDVDAIAAVQRLRVLKQVHLQALFFGSRATAQYRLERLYDHGFLERKFLTVARGEGRSPTLYILDRRGAEVLRSERGMENLKWWSSSKDLSPLFLEHTLAINDVLVAVIVACRQQGLLLEDWHTEHEIKADYDRVNLKDPITGQRTSIAVVPDAVFAFVAADRRHRCLVEVDRGTEKLEDFKQKVRAYIAYHESGQYERRYGGKSLRVLTVVDTRFSGQKRLENLKAATETVGGKRRFWFTTLGRVTPETVLTAPIWLLASEDSARALVEAD
jgi:hypothetical protein